MGAFVCQMTGSRRREYPFAMWSTTSRRHSRVRSTRSCEIFVSCSCAWSIAACAAATAASRSFRSAAICSRSAASAATAACVSAAAAAARAFAAVSWSRSAVTSSASRFLAAFHCWSSSSTATA